MKLPWIAAAISLLLNRLNLTTGFSSVGALWGSSGAARFEPLRVLGIFVSKFHLKFEKNFAHDYFNRIPFYNSLSFEIYWRINFMDCEKIRFSVKIIGTNEEHSTCNK